MAVPQARLGGRGPVPAEQQHEKADWDAFRASRKMPGDIRNNSRREMHAMALKAGLQLAHGLFSMNDQMTTPTQTSQHRHPHHTPLQRHCADVFSRHAYVRGQTCIYKCAYMSVHRYAQTHIDIYAQTCRLTCRSAVHKC